MVKLNREGKVPFVLSDLIIKQEIGRRDRRPSRLIRNGCNEIL